MLFYGARLMRGVLDRYVEVSRTGKFGTKEYHELAMPAGSIALVGDFGIGGPAAASIMEEIISAGARRVISIGGAGGLQVSQAIGDVVVCDRAVRDEGVSYHYLPPDGKFVPTSPRLTARLLEALKRRTGVKVAVGGTWTTDAPYRETREEVVQYRGEGVLTVEMEAASLAAVALHRGVEFATAFAVMDSLAEEAWRPEGFGHADVYTALNLVFDAATEALTAESAASQER